MTESFVLHSRKYDILPSFQMKCLVRELKPEEMKNEKGLVYLYEWEDLRVECMELPEEEREKYLEGFLMYVRTIGSNYPFQVIELINKLRKTTLVVNVDITPKRDPQGRAEDIIGKLCYGLKPIVYFEGTIFDHNSNIIFAPEGAFG
ncbi:MAG: hypothetical protein JW891_09535 [Candidatus Lokiarchaeota archaeon]|nr:hypothetical protein [Candidatus Lokiarchaeota archaeon]